MINLFADGLFADELFADGLFFQVGDVINLAPTCVVASNVEASRNDIAVTFDLSASTDPENDTLTYAVLPGDGSGEIQSATPVISHTYPPGIFSASCRVLDLIQSSNLVAVSVTISAIPTSILNAVSGSLSDVIDDDPLTSVSGEDLQFIFPPSRTDQGLVYTINLNAAT